MVGYAVAAQSIAYPNGFYTNDKLSISKSNCIHPKFYSLPYISARLMNS